MSGEARARLTIYDIQEAYGTGNLVLLDQAIKRSFEAFPHAITPGMREEHRKMAADDDGLVDWGPPSSHEAPAGEGGEV